MLRANNRPLEPELLINYILLFSPTFYNYKKDIYLYLSSTFKLYLLIGKLSNIEDNRNKSS